MCGVTTSSPPCRRPSPSPPQCSRERWWSSGGWALLCLARPLWRLPAAQDVDGPVLRPRPQGSVGSRLCDCSGLVEPGDRKPASWALTAPGHGTFGMSSSALSTRQEVGSCFFSPHGGEVDEGDVQRRRAVPSWLCSARCNRPRYVTNGRERARSVQRPSLQPLLQAQRERTCRREVVAMPVGLID